MSEPTTFEEWWRTTGELADDADADAEWDGQGLLYWTAAAYAAGVASQQAEIEQARAEIKEAKRQHEADMRANRNIRHRADQQFAQLADARAEIEALQTAAESEADEIAKLSAVVEAAREAERRSAAWVGDDGEPNIADYLFDEIREKLAALEEKPAEPPPPKIPLDPDWLK